MLQGYDNLWLTLSLMPCHFKTWRLQPHACKAILYVPTVAELDKMFSTICARVNDRDLSNHDLQPNEFTGLLINNKYPFLCV